MPRHKRSAPMIGFSAKDGLPLLCCCRDENSTTTRAAEKPPEVYTLIEIRTAFESMFRREANKRKKPGAWLNKEWEVLRCSLRVRKIISNPKRG